MTGSRLSPNDFAVQSAIRAFQPITPTRLAALLGMPPTTLSSYLRRLEVRRQIRRRPNPEDGRSALLEVTRSGDRAVVAALPALQGAIAQIHEHLDYPASELDLALDRLEDSLRAVLSRPDESARRPARRAPRRGR
jgi:DNA-binding MarR family transcriptional regulator